MKPLKDIVRDLRQDNRVLPRKPLTQQELDTLKREEEERRKERAEKFKQPMSGITHTRRGVVVTQRPVEPTRRIDRELAGDSAVSSDLDPDCEHEWQWKGGVKSCWLCGGAAPVDRRDSSTRWKG
jgi:hypothetical protein